jgi:hypothetical protein
MELITTPEQIDPTIDAFEKLMIEACGENDVLWDMILSRVAFRRAQQKLQARFPVTGVKPTEKI